MSKIKTKELLNEVTNYIKKELDLNVVDSFSDWGNKSTIIRKNPSFVGKENLLTTEIKYFTVCEFSVHKKGNSEFFVIWDYRDKQPYNKSKFYFKPNLNFELLFGRYEFKDRVDFYNHIKSDFGLTPFDRKKLNNNVKIINVK